MAHRRGTCTYCGRRRVVTADHVPPKNIFPSPRPSNLITVDACGPCNKGFDLDDQYFGLTIMAGIDEKRFPAATLSSVKVIKSLGRGESQRFARHMVSKQRRVWAELPSGLLAPVLAQEVEGERILGTIRRTIRGLFRAHFSRRLPDSYSTYAICTDVIGRVDSAFLRAYGIQFTALESAPAIDIGGGVFRYSVLSTSPRLPFTFWRFCFFEKRVFLGATHPRGSGPGV